jgi:hypothetical protein
MKQAVERGLVIREELEMCHRFQTDEYFRASVIGSKNFSSCAATNITVIIYWNVRSNWNKRSLIDPFGYQQIKKSGCDRILCHFPSDGYRDRN